MQEITHQNEINQPNPWLSILLATISGTVALAALVWLVMNCPSCHS